MGALHHAIAGLLLRLPVVEHGDAVGVAQVVGNAETFGFVSLIAEIMPRPPSARAVPDPAIAQMQPALERAPMAHVPRRQLRRASRESIALSLTLRAMVSGLCRPQGQQLTFNRLSISMEKRPWTEQNVSILNY